MKLFTSLLLCAGLGACTSPPSEPQSCPITPPAAKSSPAAQPVSASKTPLPDAVQAESVAALPEVRYYVISDA